MDLTISRVSQAHSGLSRKGLIRVNSEIWRRTFHLYGPVADTGITVLPTVHHVRLRLMSGG